MNTSDTSKITTLLNSPAFRAALDAADAERMAAHQAAVDELLTHEADTAELNAAQDEAETARRELQPIEAAYFAARQKHAAASGEVIRITSRREFQSNNLRVAAARKLPEVMRRTEAALTWIASDIRSAFQDRSHETRHGIVVATNRTQIDSALSQVEAMRELLGRLALEPMPADAIIKLLSAEAGKLIDAAKAAGALVAFHLPEEIRLGVAVEKSEPTERKVFALPRR